jgi:hypothetical protein
LPHLLYLIRFGLVAPGLQVEDFFDARFEEQGMAPFAGATSETRALKGKAKIIEGKVRIGTASENPGDNLFCAAHSIKE